MIGAIIDKIGGLAGKFITDKDKLAEFNHEMAMSLHKSDLAQMEINKEEAKHPSVFVSGWRPAVGWVCVAALAFNYIISPLLAWVVVFMDLNVTVPTLEMGELMTLLCGLLGMGVLRTYDKKQGTARHKI